jgi:teichuronic acid biosynthesis glycosyltransferase TuaG
VSSPRLSLVIPAYNAERFVSHAISSALSQSLSGVEVVVVDDCSTDGTADVITSFAADGVRLIRSPINGGPAAARNLGITGSDAAYVGFLDADDVLEPGWAGALIRLLDEGAAIAVADARIVDSESDRVLALYYEHVQFPPADRQRREILLDNFILSTCAVRRDRLPNPPFDTRYRGVEDWDLWMRIILAGGIARRAAEPLSVYRRGHSSLSQNRQAMLTQEVDLLGRVPREQLKQLHLEGALHRSLALRRSRLQMLRAESLEAHHPRRAGLLRLAAALPARSPRLAARGFAQAFLANRPSDPRG